MEAEVGRGSANPGVYAYLGEVCSLNGPSAEAAKWFEKAVEVDPDSLVAWRGLAKSGQEVPSELGKRANAALIRLGAEAEDLGIREPTDYRQWWLDTAKATARRFTPASTLFDLEASRMFLEKTPDQQFVNEREDHLWRPGFEPPAKRFADDRVLEAICSLVEDLKK